MQDWKLAQLRKTDSHFLFFLSGRHSLNVPVQVPHHEALEVGGHEAVEGRPGEEAVLGPLWLVVGGHVELRVPQGHADVVQQPG